MAKSKTVSAARKPARRNSRRKISKKTEDTLKTAAIGAGALAAGKGTYSTAQFVAKAGLVVAAAAAAAALIPKSMQREMAEAVSDAAKKALAQAKSFRAQI
jgi:hypothetical protein